MQTLFTKNHIAQKVQEMGIEISRDYQNKNPILLCILKGSIIFTADLMRVISIPHTLDFLKASSYGSSTTSSGNVEIESFSLNIAKRHVIVVEDIVDTGLTLQYIMTYLLKQEPASLKLCTLLNKPSARQVDIPIDYSGFTIPDAFVVGYGLDLDERYRHLPFIAIASEVD